MTSPNASPARPTSTRTMDAGRSRRSTSSAAHDGFTLRDLVSYNEKHNEANLEDNRDGTDDNRSWNCGVEGPTDDAGIRELRAANSAISSPRLFFPRVCRCCSAATSSAAPSTATTTPTARTTRSRGTTGHCRRTPRGAVRVRRRLIALRNEHPIFRRSSFFVGTRLAGELPDVWWCRPDGREWRDANWDSDAGQLGIFLNGEALSARRARPERSIRDDSFLVLFNANHEAATFILPTRRFGSRWALTLQTFAPERKPELFEAREQVLVEARSLVLLQRV